MLCLDGVFRSMYKEICTEHFGHGNGRNVEVRSVKSRYIVGSFLTSLPEYVGERNFNQGDWLIETIWNPYLKVMN